MPKLIILIALFLVVLLGWHQLKTMPPAQRKRATMQIVFWTIVCAILISVVTGRLHWVGAIIAAAAGIAKAILPKLIPYIPQIWTVLSRNKQSDNNKASQQPTPIEAAYEILELKPGASRTDIIEAHRRKMQKAHPDKGGNHELAAKLNEAKDVLLKHTNT